MLNKYREAGKIAKEALELAIELSREGISLEYIVERTEKYIEDSGGKPAFPVNISVNDVAAHYTPSAGDKKTLRMGDVIKIDVGVHIDGYIADIARTIELGNKNLDMIECVENIMKEILDNIYPQMPVCKIGSIVEKLAKERGYNPIINLSGHKLEKYRLHTGISIPNYDNGDFSLIEPYSAYAIEPFITNGRGYVIEEGNSNIYILKSNKPTELYREFLTLPFAQRWVLRKFGSDNILRSPFVHNYKILREIDRGIVAQCEHTLVVLDDRVEIITI